MRTIKDIFKLIFIILIPLFILFSPIVLSIWKDDYWYLFLFFVTWLPAAFFCKIAIFIDEL
jgi:hypothetical protein